MSDDADRDEDYFALSQDQKWADTPPVADEFDELFPANVPLPDPVPEAPLDPEPAYEPEPLVEPAPPKPLIDESLYPDLDPLPEQLDSFLAEPAAIVQEPLPEPASPKPVTPEPVSAELMAELASTVNAPNRKRKPGQSPPARTKPNRLPDPKPPRVEEPAPAAKKPFVAKKTAAQEEAVAPLEPAVAPVASPSPKKKALPKQKKKAAKAKQKQAKKKASHKKAPPSQASPTPQPQPQPRAAAPPRQTQQQQAPPQPAPKSKGIGALGITLFVLTWAAIAGCAYYFWSNQSRAQTPAESTEISEEKIVALEKKIARLEGARKLAEWADEAIAEGSRFPLQQLDLYYDNPDDQSLKSVANAEIIRVEAYYFSTQRFRNPQPNMPFISSTDPVSSLAEILIDGDHSWDVRFRAARMLSECKDDRKAAAALAEASHSESSLFVVQECIRGFQKLTGFVPPGPFDSPAVVAWWSANRSKFE